MCRDAPHNRRGASADLPLDVPSVPVVVAVGRVATTVVAVGAAVAVRPVPIAIGRILPAVVAPGLFGRDDAADGAGNGTEGTRRRGVAAAIAAIAAIAL